MERVQGALPDPRALRALRGEHQAAQEPRAADRRLRPAQAAARARGPEAADHRRRDQPLRLAAPQRRGRGRAPGRALLRLRARRRRWPRSTAWPPCSRSRRCTRASACRRWRPWPAARPWSPRASRRCPRSWATPRVLVDPYSVEDIADGLERVLGDDGPARRRWSARGRARVKHFSWERSVAPSTAATCRCWAWPPRPSSRAEQAVAEGRPRPRLADGHARRREGPALAGRASSPTRPIFTLLHVQRLASPRSWRRATIRTSVRAAPARRRRRATGSTCRSSPPRPASLDLRRLRPRDLQLALRGQGRARARRAPLHLCYCHTPDALRVGPLRRLLRPGPRVAAGAARRAARRRRRCAPGTSPPPAARATTTPPTARYVAGAHPALLRPRGGGDPAAGGHRLLHARRPTRPAPTTSWSPRSRPTSGSSWCSTPTAAPAGRSRSSAAAPRTARLRARGPAEAQFLGPVDDATLRDLYRGCRAVIMPGVEDFGIVPARGHGLRPAGGRLRRGRRRRDGGGRRDRACVFHEPTAAALRAAVDSLEGMRFNTVRAPGAGRGLQPPVFEARFRDVRGEGPGGAKTAPRGGRLHGEVPDAE